MDRDTLRHVLATLAYRIRQVVEEVPEGYPDFDAGYGVRSPVEILHHMSGVLGFAVGCFGEGPRQRLESLPWAEELRRFEDTLKELDGHLEKGDEPHAGSLSALLQGPLCDTMTHVGQLATLRRMAGRPVPGENFMKAPIAIGRLDVS